MNVHFPRRESPQIRQAKVQENFVGPEKRNKFLEKSIFKENRMYGPSWLSEWEIFKEKKSKNIFWTKKKTIINEFNFFSQAIKGGDYFDMDQAFNQPRSSQICAPSWT